MPYLIVQFHGGREQRFELTKSPFVLGRGSSVDLQIIDKKISRQHCQLAEHDGVWHLEDIPSRNKTWMGLSSVDDVTLSDGDQFRIGETYVIFRDTEDPTETFDQTPDWS